MSHVYFLQGSARYDEAEELYEAALDADPSNATVIGNFANFCFKQLDRPQRAKTLYLQVGDAVGATVGNVYSAQALLLVLQWFDPFL
jgi:Tfp pilus assembly protein PilF